MQEKLRRLRITNNPFWEELMRVNPRHQRPTVGGIVVEDIMENPDDEYEMDDSAVSLCNVMAATHRKKQPQMRHGRVATHKNGGLISAADAETLDEVPELLKTGEVQAAGEEGRGKRKRTANKMYSLAHFTRHWDNDLSDIE